jgi:hypothetical protein
MSRQIRIKTGSLVTTAELNNSQTADAIWKALPFKAQANTWGNEVYFSIPVRIGPEDQKEVVEIGDLGYWPPGCAFCIFFGPTPMSRGKEIRPASAVNVFGRITGDAKVFGVVGDGEEVTVEKILRRGY